jgi:tetratricopeptide (TPR) repeat protein
VSVSIANPATAQSSGDARELIQGALQSFARAQESTNAAERRARFENAATRFLEAATLAQRRGERPSADLLSNAGNAWLQADRPGPAVLAFRRALAIDPGERRARVNLAHLRSQLPDWLAPSDSHWSARALPFLPRPPSSEETAALAAVVFAFATLAWAAASRWRATPLRGLSALLAIIWVALLASLMTIPAGEPAVVIAREGIRLHASDSANAPMSLAQALPEGAEVRILELRQDWARIEMGDGRQGWGRISRLERVHAMGPT